MNIHQSIRLFHIKKIFSRGFTLIELLVVVTVIAALVGILLPVLKTVKENANRTKALSDIRKLELALQNYYNEYGRWPDTSGNGYVLAHLVYMLNGNMNPLDANEILGNDYYPKFNPRKIKFMEFDRASVINKTGLGIQFVDPWQKPYNILLDNGLDAAGEAWGWADLSGPGNTYRANDGCVVDRQNQIIKKSIAIYSFGPDRTDNRGALNSDDIVSWR